MTTIRKKDLYATLLLHRARINAHTEDLNDHQKQIKDILRTLRLHGEGHLANDLTPQFRELCKKVEAVRDRMDVLEAQGTHTCHNHAALQEDRKRIIDLEDRMNCGNHPDIITRIKGLEQAKGVARECSNAQAREILKMQEQIKGLENRLSRAQDMIAEMHKDGFIPVVPKKPAEKKDRDRACPSCLHSALPPNAEPCRNCCPSEWANWQPTPKPARRVRKPAGKVQG